MPTDSCLTAEDLIRMHGLAPHPEGGYFRQTYKSPVIVPNAALPAGYVGDRACSTAIYYLLREGEKSCLHKLRSDEMWHFYLGGPLHLAMIHPDGRSEDVVIGPHAVHGQHVQYVVEPGVWFGAYPAPGAGFCFVGCTVTPGFDFADFEMGTRAQLLQLFPGAKDVIERLGKE